MWAPLFDGADLAVLRAEIQRDGCGVPGLGIFSRRLRRPFGLSTITLDRHAKSGLFGNGIITSVQCSCCEDVRLVT